MMGDEWDLHAVVRSCATTNTPTTTTTTSPMTTITAATTISNSTNNPFSHSFRSPNFHDDDKSSFDFPNLIYDSHDDPFQDLHEIYQQFFGDPSPPATTTTINNTNMTSIPVSQVFQSHHESVHVEPPPQMDIQRQENIQFKNPTQGFPVNVRPQRRRKNQHVQRICQMTEEQLSSESWAWKKYGQKAIKGSPHPRNYYRCNTAKGCAARKQVERSPNNYPVTFVVTYLGDHTHSRPSDWTATSRNNPSATTEATAKDNVNTLSLQKPSFSSSSKDENAPADGGGDDFTNADDQNVFGGLTSSGILPLPSWIATSSASTSTTFNGEGSG